jgi:hypothetical protein
MLDLLHLGLDLGILLSPTLSSHSSPRFRRRQCAWAWWLPVAPPRDLTAAATCGSSAACSANYTPATGAHHCPATVSLTSRNDARSCLHMVELLQCLLQSVVAASLWAVGCPNCSRRQCGRLLLWRRSGESHAQFMLLGG